MFDNKYDHLVGEANARKRWQEEKIYSPENQPGELYSVDTPPPTVSGSLHIGHIFSYTQTDIIARFKRMSGYKVFYPFGFDDNGLPTERFVEKELGVQAHSMARSEFIKLCLQKTHEVEQRFQDLWQRMGLSVDWKYCYSTISDQARKISQQSFIRLLEHNHVYRHLEPALYCTTCRTSVAQAELDDAEHDSFFNDIVFKDEQGNELVVGTTRPELLPSCVALLYHPDDTRYQHLAGQFVFTPFFNMRVPVIADVDVIPDKGTGLVMCCTFGDSKDIEWFKRHNLPYIQSVGLDGKWMPSAGPLAGLKVAAARERVLELLKELGLLKNQKAIRHVVNVHERCKKEIEYVLLPQWFVNIRDHKEQLISIANQINWYPAFMKARYVNWVENISWDWCISRQRFFGIPFPVWHCMSCAAILPARMEDLPVDPQEQSNYFAECPQCGGDNIKPDTDVMDTWNTSSLTPYICAELYDPTITIPVDQAADRKFIPMGMRPQAHDIIRTWAFDTIVKTYLHNKTIPWKDIVISGHVLSSAQEKISKSKGNSVTGPEALLQQYSADAIRYWTASGGLGYDVPFSDNQIKIGQRLVTKLWNAFKFIAEHVRDINVQDTAPEHMGIVNEWILTRATHTFNLYQSGFAECEYARALHAIEQFFWHDFCDNYLELIKEQLFKPELYDAAQVNATRWTLYHVGLRILQWYAPYIPYITDTLYQHVYERDVKISSLHSTKYNLANTPLTWDRSAFEMQRVLEVVAILRKLKSEHHLSLKVPFACVTIAGDLDYTDIIKKHERIISAVMHVQNFEYTSEERATSCSQENEQWIATVSVYKPTGQ